MKEQDIIKAVAELDGWQDIKEYCYTYDFAGERGEFKKTQGRDPSNLGELNNLKHYTTSRDAIVPVILKAINTPELEMRFNYALYDIVNVSQKTHAETYINAVLATPEQLCKALLRSTDKWKD